MASEQCLKYTEAAARAAKKVNSVIVAGDVHPSDSALQGAVQPAAPSAASGHASKHARTEADDRDAMDDTEAGKQEDGAAGSG